MSSASVRRGPECGGYGPLNPPVRDQPERASVRFVPWVLAHGGSSQNLIENTEEQRSQRKTEHSATLCLLCFNLNSALTQFNFGVRHWSSFR